jgi:hypothetical protein
MQMHNSGISLSEIRRSIDRKYFPSTGTSTPTQLAPAGGER